MFDLDLVGFDENPQQIKHWKLHIDNRKIAAKMKCEQINMCGDFNVGHWTHKINDNH